MHVLASRLLECQASLLPGPVRANSFGRGGRISGSEHIATVA